MAVSLLSRYIPFNIPVPVYVLLDVHIVKNTISKMHVGLIHGYLQIRDPQKLTFSNRVSSYYLDTYKNFPSF